MYTHFTAPVKHTRTQLPLSSGLTQRPGRCSSGYVTTEPLATSFPVTQDRVKTHPGREGGWHVVMGGDEAMTCGHAAVALVRGSREEWGSGSGPVFPDVQAGRGGRGREGRQREGGRRQRSIWECCSSKQLSSLLPLSCSMPHWILNSDWRPPNAPPVHVRMEVYEVMLTGYALKIKKIVLN